MRVRVTLRALWALRQQVGLLRGKGGLLFAWQLWSHKLLRYLSFAPFALAWIAGAGLASPTASMQSCLVCIARAFCWRTLVILAFAQRRPAMPITLPC